MKLTPVTGIERFISIDGRTIVQISRSLRALDGWYDPPVIQDKTEVWATCHDEDRDSFQEIGQLQDVLKAIASQEMIVAAAVASPRRFAQMVATAFDLGPVFYVASRAIQAVANHIADAKRFCSIKVSPEFLNFHALRLRPYFAEQTETPGIYSVTFSLSEFVIQSRDLVAEYPKRKETGGDGVRGGM